MVRADVDPSNDIFLLDALAVKELIEFDGGRSRKVLIPGRGAARLGIFVACNHNIIFRPADVFQQPLGALGGLNICGQYGNANGPSVHTR